MRACFGRVIMELLLFLIDAALLMAIITFTFFKIRRKPNNKDWSTEFRSMKARLVDTQRQVKSMLPGDLQRYRSIFIENLEGDGAVQSDKRGECISRLRILSDEKISLNLSKAAENESQNAVLGKRTEEVGWRIISLAFGSELLRRRSPDQSTRAISGNLTEDAVGLLIMKPAKT